MCPNRFEPSVYIISDSVGETAEFVVKAATSQFVNQNMEVRKFPYIEDTDTLEEVIIGAREVGAMIVYTLVIPSLKEYIQKRTQEENVIAVDILSTIVNSMSQYIRESPSNKSGLVRQMDDEYFRKVEAIEFAVKYDDGRDPRGLLRADVVLIGVSRTSKTPLSMYLANKRFKVANVPLVPEVDPPDELFLVPRQKCIGLTIHPEQLNIIRTERLKALGLTSQANYASMERILSELDFAERVMKKVGCPVINVSNKAVEETANKIIEIIRRGEINAYGK
ncbi:MAG TPA: phosphoenolpyruvate synthase regulatory protein [Paenibacillaceae bacterium]|nr:phosphoenolpyruvate synthase regulatory protein [Paenibacillaceae bacterium]